MKSKKIPAILLTLALLAFLPPGRASAAARSYKSATHGFSFSYPETWEARQIFTDGVIVSAPQNNISANFAVDVSQPLDMAEMTGEAIAEAYGMIMDDVEILSAGTTKLDGVPCVAVDMLFTIAIQQARARQQAYMTNHNGNGYVLVFTAASEDYGKCEEVFKMILDSFRF